MNQLLPNTTTSTEIQRNYKRVLSRAQETKQPVFVLSNSKPQSVLIDYTTYQLMQNSHPSAARSDFRKYSGLWTKQEGDTFDKTIKQLFGRIESHVWQ